MLKTHRTNAKAQRVAILTALPIAAVVGFASVASAAPTDPTPAPTQTGSAANTQSIQGHTLDFVDASTMRLDGHLVSYDGQSVTVDGHAVTFRPIVTPVEGEPAPGPDLNKVGEGAAIGAGVGALAGGIPAAIIGGVGGAGVGVVIGAVGGFLVGIGTVAAGTLIAALAGCVTTGCIIDVPVFVAGLAAEAVTAIPAIAIGGVIGGAVGGLIGAGALGIPAAAAGGLLGAAVGAGVGAAAPTAIP